MTESDTDKLVEMARAAGFALMNSDECEATPAQLAAFRAAIIADLCRDVEPWVWLVAGSRVFDDVVDFTQSRAETRIAERRDSSELIPLVSALAAAALKARVAELEDFIVGIGQDLHHERVADWYPEGANNAALAMSESMRLIGNRCVDFDAALKKGQP